MYRRRRENFFFVRSTEPTSNTPLHSNSSLVFASCCGSEGQVNVIGLKGGKDAVVEDGKGDKKLIWVVDRSGGNGQGLAAIVGLEKLNPATDSAPAAAALQEGNAAPALPSDDENNPDMEPVGLLALRNFPPLLTVDGVVGMVLLFLEPKWKRPLN